MVLIKLYFLTKKIKKFVKMWKVNYDQNLEMSHKKVSQKWSHMLPRITRINLIL